MDRKQLLENIEFEPQELDVRNWPFVLIDGIKQDQREIYLRRKQAVKMYLKDCTLQEIKEATGLERVEVSRCIKRCLSRDENGSIYFQEEMTIKYHRYLIQALLNVVNPLFKFELPFTHRHIRSAPGLQNIRGFKMTFSNSLRMRGVGF